MKKIIPLSLLAVSYLAANDLQLETINVESTLISEVAQNAKTSGDVAKALSDRVPSVDMNRRNGIANDIYIRGQKRDNIVVEVDGTKVYGACPNRMDPPTSHIVAHQIDSIEVIEGPYDVTTFGALSGEVKITTKKPSQDLQGSINLGFGSWNYQKFGATVSGGTERVRVSATASTETSDQYRDGNGNTLSQQLSQQIDAYGGNANTKYASAYKDAPAYKKKSGMVKAYIKTLEDQELRLSVTANRSDNILYPNSKMDARYDNSNIYNVVYNIDNLSNVYKNINLQYYHTDVDHPMDTKYRISGVPAYMTNQLQTAMDGLKLKNSFTFDGYNLLVGLDASKRMWQGVKFATNAASGAVVPKGVSLPHTETKNKAIFAKLERSFGDLDLQFGARYDSTDITPSDPSKKARDYTALSANMLANYNLTKSSKIFFGLGKASRVPDARELYIAKGNPDLQQTTNKEVDLGYEIKTQNVTLKAKAFYSRLQDFIAYNATETIKTFENVDAKVYGAELSGSLYATERLFFDMGASYKRGKRDNPLKDQHGTNMPDMAPLRGNIAANYEYMDNSIATLELQASDRWDTYDKENKEQEIAGWTVVNAKVEHAVNKKFDLTIGVNNIFNKTYALTNTYADLTLITTDADVMLLNEPGRYFYTNLDFKF